MPFSKYSPKQKKLARVAEPRDKITKADFNKLGKGVSLAGGGKIVYKQKGSKVNEAGNYTKPTMRKNLFNKIKAGTKGGSAGQWSARKAQLLASEYKKKGGGYKS